MAVKALVAIALLVAIGLGILMPLPHGSSEAEVRSSTIPALDLGRG
jgi:hypothetical protein